MGTLAKTLPVAAIRNGTVIDHIAAGMGIKIVKLLNLASHNKQVTLGLNLPSVSLGYKDLIKVEDRELEPTEACQVAILAPNATINIIKDFDVSEKFKVEMPSSIKSVIACSNPHCITNHENVKSSLIVLQRVRGRIELECRFCRKIFSYEEIR